jgi:hypothetical protein
MEANSSPCPRCKEPLLTVLAQCYSWTPTHTGDTFLVLGLETLYRCTPCSQVYFQEEVQTLAFLSRAA